MGIIGPSDVKVVLLFIQAVLTACNSLCPSTQTGWNVKYENGDKLPEYKREYSEKIVTPHNFSFLLEPEECESGSVILVAVNSAAQNHNRRKLLRLTWANDRVLGKAVAFKFKFKVIFVLGISEDKKLEKFIKYESEQYGDILVANFKDSYCNNTYKSIYNMRWSSTACANAKLIIKADDDLLINLQQLGPFISREIDHLSNTSYFLLGKFLGDKPHRNPNFKWYLSPAEYPYEHFPKWYQGLVFFLSPKLAERIFDLSFTTPYMFADDVYVGIVADRVDGIHRKDINDYYCDHSLYDVKLISYRCVKENKLFYHLPVYDSYMYVWREITNTDLYSLA